MIGLGGESGAVVVDMKHFQSFSMDKTTWHATFGAGTLLGDLTQKLHDTGSRAFAHGVCPQVGSGGHLTIGGFGPMSRMWGTALDHIVSMKVVLADGSIVHASTAENEDVFWAMRGAGASFGIVTEFTVRTHLEPGEMVRYSYTLECGSFRSVIPVFKNWLRVVTEKDLSRKLYAQVTLCQIGMIITGTFFGSQDEYDSLGLHAQFNQNAKVNFVVIKDWLGSVAHWTEDLGLHAVGGVQCAFYSKCLAFKESDINPTKWVDDLFEYLDETDKGTLLWFLNIELQGGTTNDIPIDATAYAHRDVLLYSESFGIDIGRVDSITRNFVTGINETILRALPRSDLGSYPGYVDPALKDGQRSYWGSNLERLEIIKAKIDPTDVFHNPQSVRPAGAQNGQSASGFQSAEKQTSPKAARPSKLGCCSVF